MLRRSFVAAACMVFGSTAALAQDARVLGRDDVEFAEALVDNGYTDLARRLLVVMADRESESKAAREVAKRARDCDRRGAELREQDPNSLEADDLWLRAAEDYKSSVAPQVAGRTPANPNELRAVADRLFAYGLHFNRVPQTRISFVDWAPAGPRTGECWKKAVPIYEAALAAKDDRLVAIQLGRTYGYLQKWTDAARVYASLFEQEPMLAKDKLKLDREVMKAKPELTLAYLEWGVAEQEAAAGVADEHEHDDRLNHCIATILFPLSDSIHAASNPLVFWGANYHLVRAHMDKGLYKDAWVKTCDLMRTVSPTFDDGKFGYQKLFEATLRELR